MTKFFLTVLLALGLTANAMAMDAPDELVRNVSKEMAETVRNDKAIQAGDIKRVTEVAEAKILKYFDFQRMTGLAVGREWRNATPDQRAALASEFRTLLVRTYANALAQYKNQTIEVKPLKLAATDTDVTVRTELRQPGSKPIPMDYDMIKATDSWKVYDVSVAGVSLVTNYRETFGQEIKASGIDGLIKSLHEKNQAGAAKAAESGKK